MIKNKGFLIVSLIAMMAVSPAFSETPATQEWAITNIYNRLKSNLKTNYLNPQGDALKTINRRIADHLRDYMYVYSKDENDPVSNKLLTEGQNAFAGINEILTMVNGKDSVDGVAVELDDSFENRNAFGAINELKGEIDVLNSLIGKIYDPKTETYKIVSVADEFKPEQVF